MKERPILFSGPMVRALFDGTKTQTRRIVKYIPVLGSPSGWCAAAKSQEPGWVHIVGDYRRFCPYGTVGDRLWVRETWSAWDGFDRESEEVSGPAWRLKEQGISQAHISYRADPLTTASRWRPSIHMPRWASRITLEITSVRVERVQEIGEADAKAEGIGPVKYSGETFRKLTNPIRRPEGGDTIATRDAKTAFQNLWSSIHGSDSWDRNWVWVIEFRRIKQ